MYFKRADLDNFSDMVRKRNQIEYIVIHYTANNGDTARNNVDYFRREKVGASAHYFVDGGEVACSVPWYNVAWHCGGTKGINGSSVYGKCKNTNSIGVEMCSRKDNAGAYYFTNETINKAAEFVAELMKEYNVPLDKVVRHYDVTGKNCPAPFIPESTWKAFKNLVLRKLGNVEEEETVKYYEKIDEIPKGELRNTIADLVERGIIKGNGNGLHLSEDMVRCIVFCNRLVNNR